MFLLLDVWVLASTLIPVASAAYLGSRAENDTQAPAPLVVPPSQYWDGDDGAWSSFALRVGTPAQNVRVLVSTNSPETMVVLPLGCTTQAIKPLPSDCANARGGLFNSSLSSTWMDQGLFGINQDGVGFEANLGYSVNADYGLETLGLGFAGGPSQPTLENQTVAAFASKSPFYTGIFGLGTQPVNYTTIGNFSAPSFFTSLRSKQLIPSLSWSYTAGAKYRLKAGQYAQLIFGGFDSSRFTPNSASFTLAGDIDRDIVVGIQSITYSGTTQTSILTTPIFAFIESTDPNIWLPKAACQAIEQAFGISTDKATGLYLINSTQYAKLQTTNPQITFTLGDSLTGGETVNVVLPFGALALPASYPFTPKDTYYFPLKTAANDSQITLGRAFLQEAYLTVDYERGNFSVSQCTWQDGAPAQIESIVSSSYSATPSPTSSPTSDAATGSKKLSSGAIAGIAIGAVLVVAAAAGLAYYFFVVRHKRANAVNEEQTHPAVLPQASYLGQAQPGEVAGTDSYYGQAQPGGVVGTDSYYGQARPGEVAGTALQVWGDAAENYKIVPSPAQGSHEAPGSEIFQLAGQHERSISESTGMTQYHGVPGFRGQGFAHELEGSRPEAQEMDDVSSRGRLSPVSRAHSPPSTGALSPSSSGRYRAGSPNSSKPGSPLSSVR